MIPKFSEDFAYWMVERLIKDRILEISWGVEDNYYPEEEVKAAIRKILIESDKGEENEPQRNDKRDLQ